MVMPKGGGQDPSYRPGLEGNGERKGGVGVRQIILYSLIISVIVTFGMFQFVFFGQLVSRADFNTNLTAMNETIASNTLNTDQYALKTDLDDYAKNNQLGAYALKDEVSNPDLSDYYTRGEVDAAIAVALAAQQEAEDEAAVQDTTRWTFKDAIFISPVNGVTIDVDCDRIEEEDIYDIELEIVYYDPNPGIVDPWENVDGEAVVNSAIELTLVPRDYVMVNEDETYLDSDASPWMDWDADFTIREREGQDVCRRIVFTSQTYYGEFEDGGRATLELVLELVY